jgi:hypothetical protein
MTDNKKESTIKTYLGDTFQNIQGDLRILDGATFASNVKDQNVPQRTFDKPYCFVAHHSFGNQSDLKHQSTDVALDGEVATLVPCVVTSRSLPTLLQLHLQFCTTTPIRTVSLHVKKASGAGIECTQSNRLGKVGRNGNLAMTQNSSSTFSPERVFMTHNSGIGCNFDGNRSEAIRVTSTSQACDESLSHRSITVLSYKAGFKPGRTYEQECVKREKNSCWENTD